MGNHIVRVENVEIMALSDGVLEFDLCNVFPTIPEERWQPYEAHLPIPRTFRGSNCSTTSRQRVCAWKRSTWSS